MKEIKMDIPTAEEARRIVEQGEYPRAIEQIALVKKSIENAIGKGLRTTNGVGTLDNPVKSKLEEIGYVCETGMHYNEEYWIVSW